MGIELGLETFNIFSRCTIYNYNAHVMKKPMGIIFSVLKKKTAYKVVVS